MKPGMKFCGCGVAMMLMLTVCGGQQPAGAAKEPVKDQAADKPAAAALPMPPGAAATGKPSPFSPEMSAEFMRKVMEASARIESVKKEIAERQAVIFETNPEVKKCRAQLTAMQDEINKMLAEDKELTALKMSRDILWSTMPTLPRGNPQGGPMRGFTPVK